MLQPTIRISNPVMKPLSTIDMSNVTNGNYKRLYNRDSWIVGGLDNGLCIQNEIIGQKNGELQMLESEARDPKLRSIYTSYTKSC